MPSPTTPQGDATPDRPANGGLPDPGSAAGPIPAAGLSHTPPAVAPAAAAPRAQPAAPAGAAASAAAAAPAAAAAADAAMATGAGALAAAQPAIQPQHVTVERGCQKKTRLVWTPELHTRFLFAVEQIGLRTAVPRTILQVCAAALQPALCSGAVRTSAARSGAGVSSVRETSARSHASCQRHVCEPSGVQGVSMLSFSHIAAAAAETQPMRRNRKPTSQAFTQIL